MRSTVQIQGFQVVVSFTWDELRVIRDHMQRRPNVHASDVADFVSDAAHRRLAEITTALVAGTPLPREPGREHFDARSRPADAASSAAAPLPRGPGPAR